MAEEIKEKVSKIVEEFVQETSKEQFEEMGIGEEEGSVTLDELEKRYVTKKMVVSSLWYPLETYIKFYIIKWYLGKEKLTETLEHIINYFIKKEIGEERFNKLLEENKEKIKELLKRRKIRVVCRH